MAWLTRRLGEHSTQVALGADFTALLAMLDGRITLRDLAIALVGTLPAILMPARSA